MATTKRIAAVTMARNDDFFLARWGQYYAAQLGASNLFVVLDGLEQRLPSSLDHLGINVTNLPHQPLSRARGDKFRIAELNALAERLLTSEGYDLVVGTDCDEFIIVDPALNLTLPEYLSAQKISVGLSPLGIDLGQRMPMEGALDPAKSILAQRRYGVLSPRYTKASIKAIPTPWGSGFHRLRWRNFHIGRGLYLLHTGSCDAERIKARMDDKSRVDAGWGKHMERRARTIRATTQRQPQRAEKTFETTRRHFYRTRVPWALNKPAHVGASIVVELPERFSEIYI